MWFRPFILCKIVFINFIIAVDVGDECIPKDKVSDGVCTMLADCEIALKAVRDRRQHNLVRCGFSGNDEIVCCPQTTSKFGTSTQSTRSTQRVADRECEKITAASLPPLSLHIIGGEAASIGEFPHMVALGFDRGDGLAFDCGGTLLSHTFIITAAHCVDTIDGIRPTVVRAGVVNLGSNQQDDSIDYKIDEIILYPEYKRREKYHDIALLRTRKAIPFSSNVNAICLYTSSQDPKGQLTITGWGQTTTTRDSRSDVLLKANVVIYSLERCNASYTNWRKLPQGISSEQLCAGDPDGARDTCQGDSGGPLQGLTESDGYYRLIGITSFGRGCGSPVPGVYTRVAQYLDWIESVVWGN